MSITYPLTFPTTFNPQRARFLPQASVAVSESPFTFSQQVQAASGERWKADIVMPQGMDRAAAEPYIAFFLSLNGRSGTFLMGDPNGATPRGSAAQTPGTPLVVGGSQTGNELDVDGMPANVTGYLLAGDYIQLGTGENAHLHKLLQQVDTDTAGAATFVLWPSLRESPDDNDPVIVSNCKGLFRLSSNEMPYEITPPYWYSIAFSAVEAI